ncbi:MAG: hypothetical protein LQ340_004790, partial [Diploschistes diacapsis]
MYSVIVVEACCTSGDSTASSNPSWRQTTLAQVDRIVTAIERTAGQKARRLDSILSLGSSGVAVGQSVKVRGELQVLNKNLLLCPLRDGAIPVVAPICSTVEQTLVSVEANDVVLAITREFAGLSFEPPVPEKCASDASSQSRIAKPVSLDRIIVLDSQGGIPSLGPSNRAHVFINLEQEYEEIKDYFEKNSPMESSQRDLHKASANAKSPCEDQLEGKNQDQITGSFSDRQSKPPAAASHAANLRLARDALSLLPSSSSALITSPQAVARSESQPSPSPPG